jgi:hypothetical protein
LSQAEVGRTLPPGPQKTGRYIWGLTDPQGLKALIKCPCSKALPRLAISDGPRPSALSFPQCQRGLGGGGIFLCQTPYEECRHMEKDDRNFDDRTFTVVVTATGLVSIGLGVLLIFSF